jgi:ribokinase
MITVFGSINMDLVLPVPSIPRPGETVLCPSYQTKPGGKGANQAVAAARAGASVAMVGAVGPDGYGTELRQNLASSSIDVDGVHTTDLPTGIAAIAVDADAENAICVASGANGSVDGAWVDTSRLGSGNMLVLQMEVPPDQNWALIDRAKAAGGATMLSLAPAAPIPVATLHALDFFLVNQIEAAMVADSLGWDDTDPLSVGQRLAQEANLTCVVTLGGDGALAAEPGGTVWRQAVLPIEPLDTTGAGDTFAGVLAATLDGGQGLPVALHRAAVAAGLACTALGAQESMPSGREIDGSMGRVAGAQLVALPSQALN